MLRWVFQGVWSAAVVCVLSPNSFAAAQSRDHADAAEQAGASERSAAAGMYLPVTMAPRTDSQRGFMRVLGGYDSARSSAQVRALADLTLVGPLALRVGTVYSERTSRVRPSVGARLQLLRQERAGIDMGVALSYKPEGFTEAEGEVELVLAFARRFGRVSTFANLAYGQDPEARERDGELRFGALYAMTSALQAGIDSRLRLDLASTGAPRDDFGARYDLMIGPTASYAFGRLAMIANAGLSMVGTQRALLGATALIGMAAAL